MQVAFRWTIGDVSDLGFEALQLSVHGAYGLFGPQAKYVICANTVSEADARRRTGALPRCVQWHESKKNEVPEFLLARLDARMAEGVAWKFAPLRCFPDCYEISLDNDCIFWRVPHALGRWLLEGNASRCLIAADVTQCFGVFHDLCGPAPRNSGIRGLPPRYDIGRALRAVLDAKPDALTSELDEQGLQVAAVSHESSPAVVSVNDVTICSPFPPHLPDLGRCGAHFVGLNAKRLPWELDGRNASEHIRAHWLRHRDEIRARVT